MQRSLQANRLYHTLAGKLHKQNKVFIWDGRFETIGYPNPIKIHPRAFSYDTFRDLLKQLDWTYKKDRDGIAISSAKLTVDDMNSHIMFLEVLTVEITGEYK